MISTYIVCLVIGGVLVLLGAISGGHSGDHSIDGGHDMSHADGHADSWIPFFSLRFWTYALAGFGLCGLLTEGYAKVPTSMALPVSIGTGLAAGLGVSYIVRWAMRTEANSSAGTKDLMGATGRVMVPIRSGLPGKIRCQIKGDWIEILALPEDGETIESGEEVVILTVEKDRAMVMRKAGLTE